MESGGGGWGGGYDKVIGDPERPAHCDGATAILDESSGPRMGGALFLRSCQATFCD